MAMKYKVELGAKEYERKEWVKMAKENARKEVMKEGAKLVLEGRAICSELMPEKKGAGDMKMEEKEEKKKL